MNRILFAARLFFIISTLFTGTVLKAQTFNKIKEINTTATFGSISTFSSCAVGNTLFFSANDGNIGVELWKTDGSTASTMLVKDIRAGSTGSNINNMIEANGLIYFTADDGVNAGELWRSDGSQGGTYMVKDIRLGNTGSGIVQIYNHNGTVFFSANDGTNGLELWKTDGTEAGTVMVKDIFTGPSNSMFGTASLNAFISMGTNLYFAASSSNGRELWKSDGTDAGTVMVKDIWAGGFSAIVNHKAAVANGKLYFAATNGTAVNGTELWATDGTDAGTYLVRDIASGAASASPNNLITFNGTLFFTASSTNNGTPDLWKTDGTTAGTVMIRNLVADGIGLAVGNSNAGNQFTLVANKIFFINNTGPLGGELYVTDSTTAGTGIVKDFFPGPNSSSPLNLISFNGKLYFSVFDQSTSSRKLYTSDGTNTGTTFVTDGELSSTLTISTVNFVVKGNQLFFAGSTVEEGPEVWKTDGTSAGTNLVSDINTFVSGTPNSGATLFGSTTMNGYYYFAAASTSQGLEIWRSNGTEAGTTMIKDIWPGKGSSNPANFFTAGGFVYFSAIDNVNGNELWKTDGTEAGTVLVKDIWAGQSSSGPFRFTVSNNIVYFLAEDPINGRELWKTDGTSAGTSLVQDLVIGIGSGFPNALDFISVGNYAYYAQGKLYKVDGTTNTITELSSSIVNVNDLGVNKDTLFIIGRNASNQTILWKSFNGAAPVQVKILSSTITSGYQLTECNGKMYFNANNGTSGQEPWVSDGTEAGTYLLKDIIPGTLSSQPFQFVATGDKVYFHAASNATTGGDIELWSTDGTTVGTVLVKDIYPGSNNGLPSGMISTLDNKLLFVANDGVSGVELWKSDGTTGGTSILQDFNSSGDGFVTPGRFLNYSQDFLLTKITRGLVFFARSNDKGNQLYYGDLPSKFYVNDNSNTGDVFTSALGNNANAGTPSSPFATISYALSVAPAGSEIYIDAGTYAEQVTIDKGIKINGAGQNLTSIINPASPLVPPPGPFAEYALIQTTQNIGDVHISNLQTTNNPANNGHSILLQTGGSVKNCRIIDGSLGVYVRVESAITSVVVENNFIRSSVFAVACQGPGVTATVTNNTLNLTNAGFSVGIWVGVDFGPIAKLTATGNSINNYVYRGIVGNSNNTVLSENSILGTGQYAIENTASLAVATCNWYGSADGAVVRAKITSGVNYTPWLTNGTDNNAAVGFQSTAGTCSGYSKFYVNDGITVGDIFTSAIGNNTNSGLQSAPFATIGYALSKTQPGDTIIVDAGSYTEIVNVTKDVTLRGAGMGVTILNGPAGPVTPFSGTTETGIIQSIAGVTSVIIENMTIDGAVSNESHGTFIQGGGRISNCELRYVNDGFYFQYISNEQRTAIGNNNYVHHVNYVGALFAGNGISATASNNVIDLTDAIGGMGFIAGYGGTGNVASFTASNNKIINSKDFGILVGSIQTAQINNNSLTKIAGNFIQNNNSVNVNASCNWYGTALAASIAPQITGNVTYSPWLIDGTDNSTDFGFQPSATCPVANSFYVNNNSTVGDVFTTAVGNNANPGTFNAPYATLDYALSQVPVGATIFVDAGTYVMVDFAIIKEVAILGTNYNISPNNPVNKLEINSSRNAETVVAGATISIISNNISFKGFTLDPGDKSAFVLNNTSTLINDFGNFNYSKNILKIRMTTNNSQFSIIGKFVTSPALPVTSGYNFSDNRFEKISTATGNTIQFSYVKNITVIDNSFVTPENTLRSQQSVLLGASGIVDGFTFSNNTVANATVAVGGNRIAGAVLSGNSIDNTNIAFNNTNSMPESSTIEIINNTMGNTTGGSAFILYNRTGISIAGTTNTIKVENNIMTGIPVPGLAGQLFGSVNCTFNNTVLNPSVIIKGNKISYSGDFSLVQSNNNRPISLRGNVANVTIEQNQLLLENTGGMLPIPSPAFVINPGITINTEFFGNNMPSNAVINILNNKVDGFKQSVVFFDANNSVNNTYIGYGNIPIGATVNINNNNFTGDSISINNGTVGQSVNATCNWYGSNTEEIINPKLSLATVKHIPWLSNGTDNDAATGFQPVSNACNGYPRKLYVNDNVYTPGIDVFTTAVGSNTNNGSPEAPFATLDFVYSVAEPGDSIYVDAGNYNTNVDIILNKSITLLGVNYLASPNNQTTPLQPNASRVSESRVANHSFIIGTSDIRIKGFFFDPGNKTQIQQTNTTNDFDNIEIEKNVITSISNLPSINILGKTATPLVSFNYSITDNRFEKWFGSGVQTIFVNSLDNVQITSNVFTTNNTIVNNARIQTGIVVGSSTGDIIISNNHAFQQNFFINGISAKKTIISFNKADECIRFAFANSSNANPNEVEITDNIITNPRSTGGPVLSYVRNGGTNLSSPNIAKIERNTITVNGTGLTVVPQALIGPTLDLASANTQVFIRDNKLTITGDFSTQANANNYVSAIRFFNNSRQVVVERNEMEFTATNFGSTNKFGIGILHTNLQPDANFNFQNNKFSGFPTSVGIQNNSSGFFGQLPNGVTVNINNNSFIGDVMSINNGVTGQSAMASCNWYGSAAAQNFINKLTLSTVDIIPWLTNGTDNDIATGFQPVPNSCDGYPTLITLNGSTNVTCNGAANGTINITTTYGKAPFTYTWTKDGDANFVSNNEDPTGLAPGTYRLAITDGNGSNIYIIDENADGPGTIVVTITEPDVLTALASGDNNVCFNGFIGSASVVATGGTAPYTYLWSIGATTDEITNLIAGIYSVTVTDANGCTTNASYEVTQPTQLTINIGNGSTACSNIATVNASGGTPGYSYLWSNGSTSATISGVPVGIYGVTVTDANGCTATASVTLSVGEAFNPSASLTNVTCFGANDGIITVTNANGTGQLMFSKDGGVNFVNGSLPFSFTNLAPGTYNIAVKDVNGCTGFVERTVTQPTQLLATISNVQSTCFGLSTGAINVAVSGGEAAYSYSWTRAGGGFSSSQLNINGLAAGNYTLTVTDKNNCTAVLLATVNPFPAITIARTITNVACRGGATGSINISATGGTGGGFTYSWTGGAISSSEDLNTVAKGTYKIRVTDNGSGCIVDSTFIVIEPASNLSLTTARTNATGCSSLLGTITATGAGGTAPYSYNVNGSAYNNFTGLFTGLYAGSYTVGIKDANGCTTTKVVSITDNGGDAYEGTGPNKNNTRTRAFTIPIETVIYARIPTVADSVDWYKFTTGAAGSYTVTFNHPNSAIVFDLYTASGITPLATLAGSTPTSKKYNLGGATVYNVKVYGGLSFICYSLTVSAGIAARANNNHNQIPITENKSNPVLNADVLKAATFPNPHRGTFTLRIESPEDGIATVEMYNVNGQLLSERKVNLMKGKGNQVQYNNMNQAILFYRVRIGKHIVNGKIIGAN